MREYGFSLTCIFPHEDKIVEGQTKPLFWQILCSVALTENRTSQQLWLLYKAKT